jgi:hypothetical protein
MSATLNGLNIWEATICMPRVGAWTADVACDATTLLSGSVSLVNGGLSLRGFVLRGGSSQGVQKVRLVGGNGGLSRTLIPQGYQLVTMGQVASQLLSSVGESLSPKSTPAATQAALPAWIRAAQTAGTALTALADAAGAVWRVLPDGSIFLGMDTYPVTTPPFTLALSHDPQLGRTVYGVESLSILPATTLDGRRVSCVEHICSEDGLRSVVYWEPA